jgi:hypothetical protein
MALAVLSLVGVIHGILLIVFPDPIALYDEIGPGRFLVAISGFLLVAVTLYFARAKRSHDLVEGRQPGAAGALRVMAALGVYVVLLDLMGFLFSTFGFLLILFSCLRSVSWRRNLLAAFLYSLVLYLVFVHAFNMELPRGLVIERWSVAQDAG